jgi:hypothetical protein
MNAEYGITEKGFEKYVGPFFSGFKIHAGKKEMRLHRKVLWDILHQQPYLENSTVSTKATTLALSLVAANSPIPISATPLITSATIPLHVPLPDLEPYESVT